MSTDIPRARQLLRSALAPAATGPQMRTLIVEALALMTRTRTKRITAPAEGRKITPELEEAIWRTYAASPDWSILTIANLHDVNPGRVSEIIARRSA
ncbi:MAG: hypothetical protein RLZ51_1887 [Pseudomonadota bacterium]|jgi:hypothetical protein